MSHPSESADIRAALSRGDSSASTDAAAWQGSPASSRSLRVCELGESEPAGRAPSELLCADQIDLAIELGRTRMAREDALRLERGSVVVLDQASGDGVDILAGGRLIGRGEVVVLDERFCVRVTELLAMERAA